MPERDLPVWIPWLLSALTGGLAGALVTQAISWMKAKSEASKSQLALLKALKQELHHALWLVEYNHGRIRSMNFLHKGLASIISSNVERVLFDATAHLPLSPQLMELMHDYLEQVVYHNSLVEEYVSLVPHTQGGTKAEKRMTSCLNEVGAICTPNDKYRENDPEPSLRARIKSLIQNLELVKI